MDASRFSEEVSHFEEALNKSFCAGNNKFVILASHLKPENKKLLDHIAIKHKLKVLTMYRYHFFKFYFISAFLYSILGLFNQMLYFRPSITHVIVEANEHNITKLTVDVLFTIVRGNWLLNSECKYE